MTWDVWLDWAGTGATSRACTGRPGITPGTAPAPVLPPCVSPRLQTRPPRLSQSPRKGSGPLRLEKKAAAKKQAININVPGKGEERKDTGTQKERLHLALMCSFPQDGSSPEHTE